MKLQIFVSITRCVCSAPLSLFWCGPVLFSVRATQRVFGSAVTQTVRYCESVQKENFN